MRRALLAIGVTVLCAAIGAASASAVPTATVPVATYVRRADAVCLDVAKKALALQREAAPQVAAAGSQAEVLEVFARVYRRQLTLVRGMRTRMAAIGTPRGAKAARVARELVAGIRRGERALADVITAVDAGSEAEMRRTVARYRTISLGSARAVRDSGLGFRYCGAGA